MLSSPNKNGSKTEQHTIHDQAYPVKYSQCSKLQIQAKKSRLHRDNMLILVVTDVFEDLVMCGVRNGRCFLPSP